MLLRTLALGIFPALLTHASITVYYQAGQSPLGTSTSTITAAAANYTGSAAYNPTVLEAPPVPNPAITTAFDVQLVANGAAPAGTFMSITQEGNFFGFSVEMSVANQVFGTNASVLQVPFLNLMANLQQRGGKVQVRVGGNTQETAVLVDSTPDGKILEKDLSGLLTLYTQTPPLVFTRELLYMLSNISALVNVDWHLGIPFNDTNNLRLGIVEAGEAILGNHLIGLQAGNEPDLYADHQHRPSTYSPFDYFGEVRVLIDAMASDSSITNKNLLAGPNVATGDWTPEMVWDTGFVDSYSEQLAWLGVEHYPTDNCFVQFGTGTFRDPQLTFPNYLNHSSGQSIVAPYLNSTNFAQTKNKKLIMFETNTASCGGFAGISDSFGAALWGLDYGMQMAYSNFSAGLFHVGGQSVFYNVTIHTSPNEPIDIQPMDNRPIYYSALVMAEAIGATGTAQVQDLNANDNSIYTLPISGASDVTVSLAIGGGQTVRMGVHLGVYLQAASVSQKGNITWAGQTFGENFGSDGRLQGSEDITTVQCDSSTNTCSIKVPAHPLPSSSSRTAITAKKAHRKRHCDDGPDEDG
ncbi:hypothetical protein BDQ17DRAFT_1430785 [Cyathus striatus]|nr:hypothetical protein BDQ17DRAFT_1430785 [Cyathus striatus]